MRGRAQVHAGDSATRAVLAALVDLADVDGEVEVALEDLGPRAGVHFKTAHRAVRRLLDEGVVAVVANPGRTPVPTRYRVVSGR